MTQTVESIREVLRRVTFNGYVWSVKAEGGRLWLQACFMAPDCKTGDMACQYTRKWYVSQDATDSEIVRTAFKLVMTSIEHEAREAFKYRGQPIFSPHIDVEVLYDMCAAGEFEDQREGEPA